MSSRITLFHKVRSFYPSFFSFHRWSSATNMTARTLTPMRAWRNYVISTASRIETRMLRNTCQEFRCIDQGISCKNLRCRNKNVTGARTLISTNMFYACHIYINMTDGALHSGAY